jgi:hypothetical protein
MRSSTLYHLTTNIWHGCNAALHDMQDSKTQVCQSLPADAKITLLHQELDLLLQDDSFYSLHAPLQTITTAANTSKRRLDQMSLAPLC